MQMDTALESPTSPLVPVVGTVVPTIESDGDEDGGEQNSSETGEGNPYGIVGNEVYDGGNMPRL